MPNIDIINTIQDYQPHVTENAIYQVLDLVRIEVTTRTI